MTFYILFFDGQLRLAYACTGSLPVFFSIQWLIKFVRSQLNVECIEFSVVTKCISFPRPPTWTVSCTPLWESVVPQTPWPCKNILLHPGPGPNSGSLKPPSLCHRYSHDVRNRSCWVWSLYGFPFSSWRWTRNRQADCVQRVMRPPIGEGRIISNRRTLNVDKVDWKSCRDQKCNNVRYVMTQCSDVSNVVVAEMRRLPRTAATTTKLFCVPNDETRASHLEYIVQL